MGYAEVGDRGFKIVLASKYSEDDRFIWEQWVRVYRFRVPLGRRLVWLLEGEEFQDKWVEGKADYFTDFVGG